MPETNKQLALVREQLLKRLLFFVAFGSVFALLPSLWLSARESMWAVFFLDLLAGFIVFGLAFITNIPYQVKVFILGSVAYLLGASLLVFTGPFGAGHIFIFAFIFISALFGNTKFMVASNLLAILTHVALTVISALGLASWPQPWRSVLVISANFVLVSATLSYTASYLLKGYAKAQEEEAVQRSKVESLMSELEHRVKNNYQVMASLVRLRSQSQRDPADILVEIREMLQAMATVQNLLHRKNADTGFSLQLVLEELVSHYRKIHPNITFELLWTAAETKVRAEFASNFSIMLNEIITNAAKYAFSEQINPVIRLIAKNQEQELHFSIVDNGSGLITNAQEGTGTRIIKALAAQLCTSSEQISKAETKDGLQWNFILAPQPEN